MNFVYDLFPWEQTFVISTFGLIITGIASVIGLVRQGRIGPIRAVLLIVFVIGAALPWLTVPRFSARIKRSGETNIAETSDAADWPELKPRRYTLPLDAVADAIPDTVTSIGWTLASHEGNTFQAEVPILGGVLTDNFRITLTDEGGSTVVNVRSNSRVGRGDFGANRRHVVLFFLTLEQRLGVPTQ